jgi:hypothetical protein
MNDTETEARRLFAAATEDMPPEIDLLGGFAAARRRDRSRRTRGRAVLSAGIAAAAATVTAVTLTAGSATPALAAVTTALTSTLSQNYHVVQQDTEYDTVNGQTRTYHYTCSGAADPVRQLLAMSCSENTAVREVGGYTYDLLAGPAAGHTDGKPWVRFPAGFSPPLDFLGIDILHTAKQLLAEIKQEATVTVAGPASGPGWTGTRYAYRSSPIYGFGGTVTVDQQGRVRAMTGTIRDTVMGWTVVDEQILTFSDFGVPVTVTPPPPSQTYIAPIPQP